MYVSSCRYGPVYINSIQALVRGRRVAAAGPPRVVTPTADSIHRDPNIGAGQAGGGGGGAVHRDPDYLKKILKS